MVLLDLPVSRDYFLALFQQRGLRPRIAERTARHGGAAQPGRQRLRLRRSPTCARCTPAPPTARPLAFVPLGGGVRPLALGLATVRAEHHTRAVRAFAEHCHATLGRP